MSELFQRDGRGDTALGLYGARTGWIPRTAGVPEDCLGTRLGTRLSTGQGGSPEHHRVWPPTPLSPKRSSSKLSTYLPDNETTELTDDTMK